MKSITISSLVGIGDTDLGLLSLGDLAYAAQPGLGRRQPGEQALAWR